MDIEKIVDELQLAVNNGQESAREAFLFAQHLSETLPKVREALRKSEFGNNRRCPVCDGWHEHYGAREFKHAKDCLLNEALRALTGPERTRRPAP